jgi:hypothetical protein
VTALEAAVAQCGFRCCECQSDQVRVDREPAVGPVPVIVHWQLDDGSWCPCLAGGEAAAMASLDLLDALAAVAFVSDYGEPVGHLLVAA